MVSCGENRCVQATPVLGLGYLEGLCSLSVSTRFQEPHGNAEIHPVCTSIIIMVVQLSRHFCISWQIAAVLTVHTALTTA